MLTQQIKDILRELRKEQLIWLACIGGIFGSVSLVNLIVELLQIDLSEVISKILDFYRSFTMAVQNVVEYLTSWKAPAYVIDIFVFHNFNVCAFS